MCDDGSVENPGSPNRTVDRVNIAGGSDERSRVHVGGLECLAAMRRLGSVREKKSDIRNPGTLYTVRVSGTTKQPSRGGAVTELMLQTKQTLEKEIRHGYGKIL